MAKQKTTRRRDGEQGVLLPGLAAARPRKRPKGKTAKGRRQAAQPKVIAKGKVVTRDDRPVPRGVTVKFGRWYTTRTSIQGVARREGEVEIRPFVGPVAYVGVRYATTIGGNPGEFSSDRVECSLSVPCYPSEVEDTYIDVSEWVGRRLLQERDELLALRANRKAS